VALEADLPAEVLPDLGPVRVVRGPERIAGAWWEGEGARDYFEVESRDGRRAWIFRAPGGGRWFLHGMF
jgi:protein ImuB